ncbi:hypothetical protein V6N11_034146 [Hibiscus sabdariffa]|uniref:RNase H type-1 domain-containing protein n=1 Tax=Hibiscus sabdariffa TaxID=183260 RepID=A0ABR2S1K0_9ROSI
MTASPNLSSASIGATGQLNGRSPDDIGLVGTPRVLEHLASPVDLADTRNPKKLKGEVSLGSIAGGKNKASVEMKEPSDVSQHKRVASYALVGVFDIRLLKLSIWSGLGSISILSFVKLWLGLTKFVVNSVSNYLDDLFAQTGDIEALGVHSMDEDDPGDARDTGLRIAWSLDAYRLIMEPNSASGGSTLLPYILELISCPWEVRMQHVRRCGNTMADFMVKMASETDLIIHRYLDPPLGCEVIVSKEAALEAVTVSP